MAYLVAGGTPTAAGARRLRAPAREERQQDVHAAPQRGDGEGVELECDRVGRDAPHAEEDADHDVVGAHHHQRRDLHQEVVGGGPPDRRRVAQPARAGVMRISGGEAHQDVEPQPGEKRCGQQSLEQRIELATGRQDGRANARLRIVRALAARFERCTSPRPVSSDWSSPAASPAPPADDEPPAGTTGPQPWWHDQDRSDQRRGGEADGRAGDCDGEVQDEVGRDEAAQRLALARAAWSATKRGTVSELPKVSRLK